MIHAAEHDAAGSLRRARPLRFRAEYAAPRDNRADPHAQTPAVGDNSSSKHSTIFFRGRAKQLQAQRKENKQLRATAPNRNDLNNFSHATNRGAPTAATLIVRTLKEAAY